MLTLRQAAKTDVPFMLSLEREVMEAHAIALWGQFIPSAAPSLFDLGNSRIIETSGIVAGFMTLERAPDHLRLRKLYLSPAYQGRGLGRDVLHRMYRSALSQGLPLRLSVLRPNHRALAFYLREGMAVAEETDERLFLTFPPAEAPPPNTVDAPANRLL